MPKKVYLINRGDVSSLPAGEDARIISWHPQTSYALKRKGISFRIPNDYFDDWNFRQGLESELFRDEIGWVNRFDDALKIAIPVLQNKNIRAAYLHFSKLKYLLDTWLIYALQVDAILKAERPDEIVLVQPADNNPAAVYSIYDLKKNITREFPKLIEIVAAHHRVRFSKSGGPHKLEADAPAAAAPKVERPAGSFFYRSFKTARNFFRYGKAGKRPGVHGQTVLFLDAGTDSIDSVIQALIREGFKVLFKSGLFITDLSSWTEPVVADGSESARALTSKYRNDSAARTASQGSGLAEMLVKWSGIDFSAVLAPYLLHFVSDLIPQVAAEYEWLESFTQKNKIHFIVSRGSSGINYPAAIQLAKNYPNIHSVCFQHGWGPVNNPDWAFGELDYFDTFAAMDCLTALAFKRLASQSWLSPCKVVEFSQFPTSAAAKPVPRNSAGKQTVLYMPNKSFSATRKINTFLYEPTWFFGLQKKIIDYFASQSEFRLIYKHHFSTDWANASILSYIRSSGFRNIEIETGPPSRYFSKADRVLLDFPSTPLFETANAGMSVLCLYPSCVQILPEMTLFFGDILQSFKTGDEAVAFIADFLSNDPSRYRRVMPSGADKTIEVFSTHRVLSSPSKLEEILRI